MANNDIEIEIRIPLERKTFILVKRKIKEIGKFVKKVSQEDEYFIPARRNFLKPRFPFEWLSIRRRGIRQS